jgi:hypothetical protein
VIPVTALAGGREEEETEEENQEKEEIEDLEELEPGENSHKSGDEKDLELSENEFIEAIINTNGSQEKNKKKDDAGDGGEGNGDGSGDGNASPSAEDEFLVEEDLDDLLHPLSKEGISFFFLPFIFCFVVVS